MKKITKKISLFLVFVLISILFFSCSSSQKAQIIEVDETYNIDDIEVQVINLGKVINSSENDYTFKQAHDGENAFLTSNRRLGRKTSREDDIWIVPRKNNAWREPKNAGSSLNIEDNYNPSGDGACAISFDGTTLYFASSRDGGFGNVDIYTATLEAGEWKDVKNIGAPINTKWFESHPSISSDNKTLYFVSNRPGGYGKDDIWYSERDDDGLWDEPINMGPEVNTLEHESSPVIAADNSTLYFSSNGLPGYGEHDLFVVYKENGKWGKPLNLGSQVNSVYNDRFPYVPTSGQTFYFSSDRPGGSGKYDVYIAIPNPKPPKRVTTISGIVNASLDNQPMQVKIKVVEVDSKESVELESERLTGKYFSVIPNGKKYEVSVKAENYIPYSQVVEVPIKDSDVEIVHNISLTRISNNLNITVSHVLPSSETIETDPMLVGFKGLLLKEVIVYETVPLLNYIFFDKESSKIPLRYKLFESANETEGFTENNLYGGNLIQYYHILNIVGSRMKARPNVKITLVGCNDNLDKESGNTELSKARANAVQEYLTSIWSIEQERIKVTTRNLPDNPSSQSTVDGQAENRRVEIIVDAGNLLESTYTESNELLATPEKVDFTIITVSDKPMKGWILNITQDGKMLKRFTGNKDDMSTVTWNWLDTNNQLPQGDKPIVYSGVVYTADNDSAVSSFSEIPVRKVVLISSSEEKQIGDKVFEKITLILYEFNQSNIGPQNMEILRTIFPKITPDARVSVNGHTDNIGSDEANLALSRDRAKVVHDTLKENRRARSYKYEGLGKTNPLYNNLLPEGRFYNRTVQIIIERDIRP
jgi:outer membrane protein OmpA-like peptidoglycan-associated protein